MLATPLIEKKQIYISRNANDKIIFLSINLLKIMFTFVSIKYTINLQKCHKLNLIKVIFLLSILGETVVFRVYRIIDLVYGKDFPKECNKLLYKMGSRNLFALFRCTNRCTNIVLCWILISVLWSRHQVLPIENIFCEFYFTHFKFF